MGRTNIAILFGGRSGEHDVSLLSAASIVKHLDPDQYIPQIIGVDKNGHWYYQPKAEFTSTGGLKIRTEHPVNLSLRGEFLCDKRIVPVDVVFPIIHGSFGEDGTLQGLLEQLNLPYVGCGVRGSALGMDKDLAKRLWMQQGLPVVPYLTVQKGSFREVEYQRNILSRVTSELGFPVFIKPANTGSSVGIRKSDEKSLLENIEYALRFDTKALIEPAVAAREIECSVIGNHAPRAFEPGEVVTCHSHAFYDYQAKYIDPDGAELHIPAEITPEQRNEVRQIACKAFSAIEARGFARVDFFLDKDTGKLMLNEINTLPGFTERSMFSMMCASTGLEYGAMLSELILLAVERYKERNSLQYTV